MGRLEKPLDPARTMSLVLEIAHALAIIHAAGVVHRDLKPGNVMLRTDGTVALIDFGISQSKLEPEAATGARDGEISGTPYYMSPEQVRGEPTDERTDLYALGIMAYEMLTGEKPYVGVDTDAILEQHELAPIPVLPTALHGYQPLIDRLLAKAVAQRLASARELVELIDALDQPAPVVEQPLSVSSG